MFPFQNRMCKTGDIPADGLPRDYVLVLGASGFIGREVLASLDQQQIGLVAGVHRQPAAATNLVCLQLDLRKFDWNQLQTHPPKYIIHLGRIPGRGPLSRRIAGWQGQAASERMVRWLRSLNRPPHVVYVSGTLVYGDRPGVETDETAPLDPISFQRAYVKAEYPFIEAMEEGLPVSIVRPPWVVGPGSWFRQFYMGWYRKRGSIPLFGSGKQIMSLVHVADCGRMIGEIALQEPGGGVYNLYSGVPMQHEQFCEYTAELLNARIERISATVLNRKFGKAVREALTFSLHSVSRQQIVLTSDRVYPEAGDAIRASVEALG